MKMVRVTKTAVIIEARMPRIERHGKSLDRAGAELEEERAP